MTVRTQEQRYEEHNKTVASVMKMLAAMDKAGVGHDSANCPTGELCKVDAIKALLNGKGTATQQEMAACVLAEELLQAAPLMALMLALVRQDKEKGNE